MWTRLYILCVGALLVLAQSPEAGAFLARDRVKVSAEVIVNAVEASPHSDCGVSEELRTHWKSELWVSVAETGSHRMRCGSGSFDKTQSGAPYLIAKVLTTASLRRQMEDPPGHRDS